MPELFAPKELKVSKDSVPVMRMGGYAGQWVEWAGYAMAFEVVPKGFPPGGEGAFQGLPENYCQCPHWGYLLNGTARLRLTDGSETIINAGDLYYAPPGHQLYALEDFENIEFNPAEAARKTMDAFAANISSMGKE
jgi:hypothetical protein